MVVAAVIIRAGRVLAAQRNHPPALAGFWEFAGGKVEGSESEPDALIRECREELRVEVIPIERLGPDVATVGNKGILRAWLATIDDDAEPMAVEHRQLRWLALEDLDSVDWLPSDGPIVAAVGALLARGHVTEHDPADGP